MDNCRMFYCLKAIGRVMTLLLYSIFLLLNEDSARILSLVLD